MSRREVTVQVIWADGRSQHTTVGGLASMVIMPVELPNGRHRPAVFVREIVDFPAGWHGPFASEWWVDGDLRIVRMIRFREATAS